MRIVFDTNVIFQNWYLKGPNFELLEKYLGLLDVKLIVPKIVIAEAKNKYREMVNKTYMTATKEFEKLKRLLPPSFAIHQSVIELDNVCKEYERAFDERLSELDAEMPDHDDIPHKDLIDRDLARRKPFQPSGKGYRDSLLWEVIIRKIADPSDITILITSDENDFRESTDRQLHGDLKEDMRLKNLPDNCIQLCHSIEEFNEKYVKSTLTVLTEAKSQIKKGTFHGFSPELWFLENREQITAGLQREVDSLIESHSQLTGYEIDDPTISYIEDPSKLEIDDIFELDVERVFIDMIAEADINIDLFVSKPDYYSMPDDIPLDIWDGDWNEHYVWAAIILKVHISLSLVFNIRERRVEEFEAKFIETFGWCKFCGEPLSETAEECPACGKSLISPDYLKSLNNPKDKPLL